jgi:ribulose-bisphosphate carboxylase small chain
VRLTQGCFSFLPDLSDEQIEKQIAYCITKGWAMNVEWTDDYGVYLYLISKMQLL